MHQIAFSLLAKENFTSKLFSHELYIYIYTHTHTYIWLSQVALVISNTPANAGDLRDAGSILGSGGSPGGGHGNPLQYSCLENPHRQRSLAATVHEVAQSDTTEQLSTAHSRSERHFEPFQHN